MVAYGRVTCHPLKNMFDFDKNYEEYVIHWYESHRDELEDEDALEDKMPELYEEWARRPLDELSGLSPQTFFRNIEAPDLIKLMVSSCEGEQNPCSLLLDNIVQNEACAQGLRDIIRTSQNAKAKVIAANLLTEMGAEHPLDVYARNICDRAVDESLREIGIEVLCEHADAVADTLYRLIPDADLAQKGMIAEVLVNAARDDRTLRLLEELFAQGDNIPFYASLMGKYGDERASAMLYRALDSCNYMEYVEIKNAIERMGGVVDDVRDFSDDPYFAAMKNVK